ncbi:MAG: hypothetical protein ACYDC4_15600 [Candidatus Dormibacteria bacterium]
MARLIQQGEVVYVHCRAGLQRASMMASAVLTRTSHALGDAP